MNPSIKNQISNSKIQISAANTNLLTGPLGSMFSWNCGTEKKYVGKVEENTFEIFNVSQSATVDGDTLINLFLGKTNLSTLKFQ